MFRGILAVVVLLAAGASIARADATVGAYYYPWYGPNGGHTFNDTLRMHLTPDAEPPALGAYNSRDLSVIDSQIDQSHLGNISMWSMSWWGPGTYEDTTIRNYILPNPRASELKYTIHYESVGRLGSGGNANFDNPNYAQLTTDFQYLGQHIFNDPNYMRIDGRPVIVMYLSREYFKNAAGWAALDGVRSMMESTFGYDPYIIGDHVFNTLAPGAEHLDAVTGFDVYGQVFSGKPTSIAEINKLASIYSVAEAQANALGVDFIPGVSPGYNDKVVRPGNAPATRYVADPGYGPDAQGSTLREIIDRAALPHTDPDVDNLIMVNSFNEWHEDTEVEASVITPRTTTDNTPTGTGFTAGKYYEGYGNLYLDILRQETRAEVPGDFNNDGRVDGLDLTGVNGWQSRFGGDLGASDFLAWQQNLGFSLWATPAGRPAPEPAAGVLAACITAAACVARKRL